MDGRGRLAGPGGRQNRAAGRTWWPVRQRGWRKGTVGGTWRQTEQGRAGWLVGVLEGSRCGRMVGEGIGMVGEQDGWREGGGTGRDRAGDGEGG